MAGKRRFTVEILGDEKDLTKAARRGEQALGDLEDAATDAGRGIVQASDRARVSVEKLTDEQLEQHAAQVQVRKAALDLAAAQRAVERSQSNLRGTEESRQRALVRLSRAEITHAKAVRAAAKDAADAVEDAADRSTRGYLSLSKGLGSGLRAGITGAMQGAAASILAAGVVLGTAAMKGFRQGLDALDTKAALKVRLGLSPEEASRLGAVAGRVYAGAYGDSLDEVNSALRSVISSGAAMRDASDAQLEDITGKVLNLSKTFEQDLGATTRAVGQMIRTGLARDAGEALDIITRGFQTGGDKADDLLDTVNEYGTQWRKVGLSGAQAMGLISQGLRAGARDSDIVADAIKEFSIRAVDGSKLTAEGFKSIGLNAGDMAARIGAGGKTANDALDLTLDRLRRIEDPVKRSQTAVALFGTQAEDLGDALFALDPSSAVAALGKVGGAADQMGKDLTTPRAQLTAIKRQLEQRMTAGILEVFDWVKANRAEVTEGLFAVARGLLAMSPALGVVAAGALYAGAGLLYLAAAKAKISGKDEAASRLFEMAGGMKDAAGSAVRLSADITKRMMPALDAAEQDLKGQNLAARAAASGNAAAARAAVGLSRQSIAAARNVRGVTGALRGVPRNTTFRVRGDTSQARGAIGDILRRLSVLQNGRTVHVVQIVGDNQVNYGGGVGRGGRTAAWRGGEVRGGIPGRDSVPAILAPGEVVADTELTKAMKRYFLGGRGPAGAAGGGVVVLEVRSGGSRLDDLLVEILRNAVRVRGGGNVQLALGRG